MQDLRSEISRRNLFIGGGKNVEKPRLFRVWWILYREIATKITHVPCKGLLNCTSIKKISAMQIFAQWNSALRCPLQLSLYIVEFCESSYNSKYGILH